MKFKIIGTVFLMTSWWVTYAQSEASVANPALFLPGVVSTGLHERDMAISPDGSDMYYTLLSNQNAFSTILYRKKLSGGKWSDPIVASFSGQYKDLEPAFSPDGNKLYFSSNRPIVGKEPKDYNLWVVEKVNGKWSTAKDLGDRINTDADEFYPSVSKSGNLYFTAAYEKGIGKEDIYVSQWINGAFAESVALDSAVNSKVWEFNAFVAPDEQYILFTAYGRKDDTGGGDLYISVKDNQGKWQPSKNLGAINSKKLDYCPFVSADQKTLFFTSQRHVLPTQYEQPTSYEALVRAYNGSANGSDDIYTVDFQKVLTSFK